MSLSQVGVRSLLAVNSWLGVINSNLQGSSRTGFKTIRPHLTDGPSGLGYLGDFNQLFAPPATLNVQATSIEWAQGAIVNSGVSTHFALQGQGFFVVTDAAGRYYLTRDGEFHWDGNGYLVNSAGLRVLSNGQDFIRMDRRDRSDIFREDGSSQELLRYGDKSLLIVDVANRDGLRMSQYGSTVFALDGDLPLQVQNDFSQTMDGLTFVYRDPKQRTYVDAPEMPAFVTGPPGPSTNFTIDFGGNGTFDYEAFTGLPFDPATTTIQQLVAAINNYGLANGVNISAVFDADTDQLSITNIPEPKVVDPGFRVGGFSIDFGQNGVFTYPGPDPRELTIQGLVDQINLYAQKGGFNIVASYNPATDTFSLSNTTVPGGNNQILFGGANGDSLANFMRLPVATFSNGLGLNSLTSAGDIDRFPLLSPLNLLTDISPQDVTSTQIRQLIKPESMMYLRGPNGQALTQFFRLTSTSVVSDPAGNPGIELRSNRDIDNSSLLNSSNPVNHSLDIQPGDVATRSLLSYITTTDTTVPAFDFSGPPPAYLHDKPNSRVVSDGTTNNGHGLLLIGQAQTTRSFDLVFDYHTTAQQIELHFGFDNPEQIDSSGLTFFYNPTTGDINLVQREKNPNKPPLVISSFPGVFPATTGLGGPSHRFAARMNEDGLFSVSVNGAVRSFDLASNQYRAGYLAIGHQNNRLEIENLRADFKAVQNVAATGQLVSISPNYYASPEVREAWQDRTRTRIVQASLESSTASLTEYVPLLALVQKVFASISKVISAHNAMLDDMNSLLR